MPRPPRKCSSVVALRIAAALGMCAIVASAILSAQLSALGAWPAFVAGAVSNSSGPWLSRWRAEGRSARRRFCRRSSRAWGMRRREVGEEAPARPRVTSMPDVFVDSRRHSEFVQRLAESMSQRGKQVWLDTEGIADAEVFPAAIKRAIEQSDAFLFVITPSAVDSAYCENEVEYAKRNAEADRAGAARAGARRASCPPRFAIATGFRSPTTPSSTLRWGGWSRRWTRIWRPRKLTHAGWSKRSSGMRRAGTRAFCCGAPS